MLTPAELALKQPKVRPLVADDCSDVRHTLAQLTKPTRTIDKRPPRNMGPLSADETAIYRAVLQKWIAGDRSRVNVSLETYPLDVTSHSNAILCNCLRSIEGDSLFAAYHSVHILAPAVLPRKNMKLVDADEQTTFVAKNDPGNSIRNGKSVETAVADAFATGLFSLSEIAFDREHRRAIVSYSFHCGMLCGSGRTLVFEKVGNEWRRTDLECGGWVS